MRRLISYAALAAVLVAAGTFWACNDSLDDPTVSEGLLTVEAVDPVLVEADINPNDPNGLFVGDLTDDTVNITVKNRPRVSSATSLSDIFINQFVRTCTTPTGATTGGTGIASFIIPSGSTAVVTITAVTVNEKTTLASVGETWICSARLGGEDISGNPVQSEVAAFAISMGNL